MASSSSSSFAILFVVLILSLVNEAVVARDVPVDSKMFVDGPGPFVRSKSLNYNPIVRSPGGNVVSITVTRSYIRGGEDVLVAHLSSLAPPSVVLESEPHKNQVHLLVYPDVNFLLPPHYC